MHKFRPFCNEPKWFEKYPMIYDLMSKTGKAQYEIANIIGLHPDSFGRKLRYGTLTDEDIEWIIDTVNAYVEEHSHEQATN